jgi:ATP-dependent helicase/nuclease subunit B
VTLADYADMFAVLIADYPVRPPLDPHARIRILGPLEARLLDVDALVLGGLNEGTWPPEAHADAWLNRPMRRKLGLDLPDRRIGLAAHDFAQSMGMGDVVLTRASRQNGVETVASRFLQRLAAVAPDAALAAARDRGSTFLALARALDRPAEPKPVGRPLPCPPVAARPTRLSVSEIEDLVRDPYTIYARHVLGLVPLEPINAEPGAAARGMLLHEALARFTAEFPGALPAHALDTLIDIGRRVFAPFEHFPDVHATWWPRFERVAHWFVVNETKRRARIATTLTETSGKLAIDLDGVGFTLSARADRIDRLKDGSIAVIDYKTGAAPTVKEALVGLAPQLPLEAAIARHGGFAGIAAGTTVSEISAVKLSGGDPPGEFSAFEFIRGDAKKIAERLGIADLDDMAERSLVELTKLLRAFARADQPYHSMPRPKWRSRYGAYDHLARVKEWSVEGDEP